MNKQTIAVSVAAVVLFAVALVGALTFTGNDSGAGNVHTMPHGQTVTGPMNGMNDMDAMMGHPMSNSQTMTGPMHTMPSSQQMPGMTHEAP